jgi:hypothetical protein
MYPRDTSAEKADALLFPAADATAVRHRHAHRMPLNAVLFIIRSTVCMTA